MKRLLPALIVGLVALSAVIAGSVLYRHFTVPGITEEGSSKGDGKTVHVRGFAAAPVTVEEFGDFQCPPCGTLSEPLNQIERDYTKKIRLIFRQFPLASHAFAKPAAYAAEAAGLQGKFWEMHDLLYRNQSEWSKLPEPAAAFTNYARQIGLDLRRFAEDSAGEIVKKRVLDDQARAATLGVSVTPTVLVNGKSIAGPAHNPPGIREAIDAALSESTRK